MPSATPTTSRWPVSSTPIATSTLTFSTDPPHVRLCHTPSTNRYGYERSNGLLRHSSICAYTPLSLSESVCEGIRSPHSRRLMSST